MNEAGWEILDHTGDIALRVFAPDLEGLFTAAVPALFDVIVDVRTVEPRDRSPVAIDGAVDEADLLVRFLSELLYRHDAEGRLFRDARIVRMEPTRLAAEAIGEAFDPARHAIAREVKAVTYHGLALTRTPRGVEARIVLDL